MLSEERLREIEARASWSDIDPLLAEVRRLRAALDEVQGMTGDPAILRTIDAALGRSEQFVPPIPHDPFDEPAPR